MDKREVISTSQGELRFELEWPENSAARYGPSFGKMSVYLEGFPVWPTQDERSSRDGIHATWIELLEYLNRYWLYLVLEQGYPFNVSPRWPSELDASLIARWENSSAEAQRQEEEQAYAFKLCHNLAQATPGSLRPDLWIVRDGGVFVVEALAGGQSLVEYIAASEVKRVLSEVGDAIVRRLEPNNDSRSMAAVADWSRRDVADPVTEACVATGLPTDYFNEIAAEQSIFDLVHDPLAAWAGENVFLDVAYRCKGVVPPSRMKAVLQEVRASTDLVTRALEDISSAATNTLSGVEVSWSPPFQQGHALAIWLRSQLNNPTDRVEPDELLSTWSVSVRGFDFAVASLDAVAFWAHGKRPCVLWNSSEKHNRNEGARRATLAHEICHLLVDRTNALPLSAVVGGPMDKRLEQRANAFAAELLCPRREAGLDYRYDRDVGASIRRLTRRYGVSNELAVLQLARSGEHFDIAAKHEIRQLGPSDAIYPW